MPRRDPRHPALIDARRTLDYGELDALMDRIAAALQRDGVRPQRGDRDLRQRLGRVRRGLSRRAARRRRRRAAGAGRDGEEPGRHARRCGREAAVRRCRHGGELRRGRWPRRAAHRASTARPKAARFEAWLAPDGAAPAPVVARARLGVQHHLFLGHHRHAQGHRPAARDALGAGAPRRHAYGYGPDAVTLLADAALLEHHAGGLPADAGLGRHARC